MHVFFFFPISPSNQMHGEHTNCFMISRYIMCISRYIMVFMKCFSLPTLLIWPILLLKLEWALVLSDEYIKWKRTLDIDWNYTLCFQVQERWIKWTASPDLKHESSVHWTPSSILAGVWRQGDGFLLYDAVYSLEMFAMAPIWEFRWLGQPLWNLVTDI